MKPTPFFVCAAAVAACASVDSPTPLEAVRLDEARRLLDSRPEDALAITDDVLRANPGCWKARLIDGEGSLRLVRLGRGRGDLLLDDAIHAFEKGLGAAPAGSEPEARKLLAECYHDRERYEEGAATARTAAEAFGARNTATDNRLAAEARMLAARCDLRIFAKARRAELDAAGKGTNRVPASTATMRLASVAAAEFASARTDFPGDAATQIATIHQWLGQDAAAVEELERGIVSTPQETAIHDAYIRWMSATGQYDALVGAYSRFVRGAPDVPVLRWHQGRAIFARADQLRSQGNFQGATTAYQKARATFAEYLAMMPSHAESTNQWLALCDLSIARVATEVGDTKTAEARVLAAARASALTTEYDGDKPRLADSFGSHFTAAVFAVHRALADSGADALVRTLAFNEAVIAQCPDRFGFVHNNAALAARDLGVQRANDGDTKAAKELWERSYRHYEEAVALSPEDARIVNDCGLMLVYHLGRDFDHARALFERAITLGEAQLAALPSGADAAAREPIEEAVGDAYQNIAVLLRDHQKAPLATWRPFCEKAVKYFPYQRREAARFLREDGGDAARNTAAAPQGGAAEVFAKVQSVVADKVKAQDLDGALVALDGIAKECRDLAPYHQLRGEVTLQFARQSRDSGRKGTGLQYQDAIAALQRAVELDGEAVAPRQELGEAQFEAGDADAATKTVSALLLHLQSKGGGKPADVLAAHTLRANAGARAYAAKKEQGGDDADLLAGVRASFRLLEEKGKLEAPLRTLWSTTEQWAGAPAEAVNVHVRALAKAPDDQTVLAAIVDTAAAQKQLPLAIEALGTRTDATSLWYLGRALYLLAAAQREDGKTADALKTLDDAQKRFQASMQKNGQYRDSCEQWAAMCLGKKGNIAFHGDDLANAEAWLLAAIRMRPDRIGEDLGLGETTKVGIQLVADRYYRQKDLAKVEAIYRAAADAANGDPDLLNNAGLFARDHGNDLERAGKKQEAMAMYEQSYKAYRRAQELDPKNVRLRNDCALIAIYHLDRDWDLSKRMLESAIADGEKTLRDDPPEHPDTKQQLDEAVGDCYENLALWHLKHDKDAVAAKAAAESSLKHWPGERRPGAHRHIEAAQRLQQGK